jgi:hypothetical protein
MAQQNEMLRQLAHVSHHLSTMVVVIITSVPRQQQPTRSFSVLSRRCSPGRKIHLTLMFGSGWWNPNSHCLMENVPMRPRSVLPHTSFVGLSGHGGTISSLCSRFDHMVEWGEFKAAFRGHHIPAGIMDRKLNEFLAPTQGSRTVLEYAQAFNDLCQYAGYHADTDEKKRDRFRRGLSTKLYDRINTIRANNYNELVNMAISQEDCITARQAEKKRKNPIAGPSAQPQHFRIVSNTQNRGPQQQQGRWVIRP